MKLKPYQKTERKIMIWLVIAVIVFGAAVYIFGGNVFSKDSETGTIYRDKGDYSEVVFSSGEVLAYGNENSEYENGEIGE